MIPIKKLKAIKKMLFDNRQSEMASALNISQSKISKALVGDQELPTSVVGLLINKYHIDAVWLFAIDDDVKVKFIDAKVSLTAYEELRKEKNELQEMLIQYQKNEINRLKNIEKLSNTP